LEVEDTPTWGTMTAPQMVEHCTRFNDLYLGRARAPFMIRIIARLFGGGFVRKLLEKSPFAMKRGIGTLGQLRVQEPMDPNRFAQAKDNLSTTLHQIEAISGTWNHPLYGRIEASVGQALARHHLTHHLHQFGKLP